MAGIGGADCLVPHTMRGVVPATQAAAVKIPAPNFRPRFSASKMMGLSHARFSVRHPLKTKRFLRLYPLHIFTFLVFVGWIVFFDTSRVLLATKIGGFHLTNLFGEFSLTRVTAHPQSVGSKARRVLARPGCPEAPHAKKRSSRKGRRHAGRAELIARKSALNHAEHWP